MTFREDLHTIKTVVTHAHCADGTASAILLRDAFLAQKQEVRFQFVQHGTDDYKNLKAEPGILFCDMSPPEDRADEFIQAGALVLDHHKTARGVVERFGKNGIFGDEVSDPGVCGAVLAYEHVWKPFHSKLTGLTDGTLNNFFEKYEKFVLHFATLAGIRDTWQRSSPLWGKACEQQRVLTFYPTEYWMSQTLVSIFGNRDALDELGKVLEAKHHRAVADTAAEAYRFTTKKGTRVAMFQGTGKTSDVSELLFGQVDLVIGFHYKFQDGKLIVIYSTRTSTTFDCGGFCKKQGGGGHTKAAGFSWDVVREDLNPYATLEFLVDRWEAV